MTRLLVLAAAFLAFLALPVSAQAQQWQWDHVARVVIMGDLHGDYAKFEDQLKTAGLVDANLNWSGGHTHLVQLGDVPDRAPDTRRILDLLMRLEPQALRAGGYVHALIGNHEAMNMQGDLRYTTPGEFAAFADRNSPRRRDEYYQRYIAALRAHPPAGGLPQFDAAFRAQFDQEHPLGWVEHMAAWSPSGTYGRWVTTHNAIIRIDDALYLHAGIGPDYIHYDIGAMNDAVRAALLGQPEPPNGPPDILGDSGPLWYRGLALTDDQTEATHAAALLTRYGVRHVVVGHTKRYSTVTPRFGGAVILTDIAVPAGYADPHAFLIKQGDVFTTMHRGHNVQMAMSAPGLCTYLSQIAALDASGGPVAAAATQCASPEPTH